MNERHTSMRLPKMSAQTSGTERSARLADSTGIPRTSQTLHSDSPDSDTILNNVKSLDPIAQVLALHDALIEHATRDPSTTEAFASALLERAFEPGHAETRKGNSVLLPAAANPSQHTSSSHSIHPASQAPPRAALEASNPVLSREEQLRALRVKYGLAEADTGDSFAQFWKNSTKSITRLAGSALAAFGGTSPATREQARNLAREALVGTWILLPASIRKAASSAQGLDLGGACQRLLAMPVDTNGIHHAGACAWVLEECELGHLPQIVPLLRCSAAPARRAAERSLFAFCYVLAASRIPEWITLALQGARLGDGEDLAALPDVAWKGWGWEASLRRSERAAALNDVTRALASALDSFDQHNNRVVLLSAIALLDPARRALAASRTASASSDPWSVLSHEEHPAQSSLAGLLRTSRWPLARLRALQWLALEPGVSPRVARACAARLSVAHGPQDHEALLHVAHLCQRPTRGEHLAKVIARGARSLTRAGDSVSRSGASRAAASTMTSELLDRLTPQARRMLPLWHSKIGLDAPLRERTLTSLLTDASPDVRLSLCCRATSSLRHDLLFDTDGRVARAALLAVADDLHVRNERRTSQAPPEEPARSLRLLRLSANAQLRLAAEREEQGTGDAFTDTRAGRLRAIRWLSEDRAQCIDSLREALQAPSSTTLSTLRLVRLLRLACEMEEQLLRLSIATAPEHSRIAATAVSLLAGVKSESAKRVLTSCLLHPDARVRANTVESLGRLDAPLLANTIIEVKHDKHHRVSANAMRAGMLMVIAGKDAGPNTSDESAAPAASSAPALRPHQLREARGVGIIAETWRDDLASLLTNDSVMHRLAGVWLATRTLPLLHSHVDRLAWAESSQRIAEMADFDGDMRVRRRAAACAALVEGATRFQWRGSAA